PPRRRARPSDPGQHDRARPVPDETARGRARRTRRRDAGRQSDRADRATGRRGRDRALPCLTGILVHHWSGDPAGWRVEHHGEGRQIMSYQVPSTEYEFLWRHVIDSEDTLRRATDGALTVDDA